ncbi:hypothetical protein D3C87_1880840 [compost metagenome]
MTVTFEQAKELLANCKRSELRDHAFGDREIYFEDAQGVSVAEGYAGSGGYSINFVAGAYFDGTEARELIALGHEGKIERNDSTGPDEFEDGKCMPGLTHDGVRKELEGE